MKNEKGFTLIELVVSIAVLSIIIVPFFGIFTNAAKLDMRSKKDLTANYLAQHLASEAKEHPMTHSGWDESLSGSTAVFTKDPLEGDYSKYSAVLTYDDFTHSVESNGYENLSFGNNDYAADFTFIWDESEKGLGYYFDTDLSGYESGGANIEDTSNNVEINLENDEDAGIDSFLIEVKINNDNPLAEYRFDLDTDVDFIRIKASLDPDSGIHHKNRTITVANSTKDQNNISRHISLFVDSENLGDGSTNSDDGDNYVNIKPQGSGDINFTNLDDISVTSTENILKLLTVEISGYDPITGTVKVLKKLVTTVRTVS